MIGLSHYPMTNSQMTWKAMNSAAILNIKTLASKYGCKVMVCEVGVKASASEIATSTQCLTDFMNSVKSLSVCAGVFYWEPQVDGKWRPAIMRNRGATGVPTIWVHSHPMVQLSPRHQFSQLSENEVRCSVTSTSSVTGDRVLWPGRRGNVSDYFSRGKRP